MTELPLPVRRPRRLRRSAALRELVAETRLHAGRLVAPFFVVPGRGETQEIATLPGVSRFSVDRLLPRLERALELGVRSVVLFGVVPADWKDPRGSHADDAEGPVPKALREAKRAFGDELTLITDVCLCGYTEHGHCGVLSPGRRGALIDNDASLPRLASMAVAHAEAGADLVSPSDMMDGRVAYLRAALDEAGYEGVGILSYAVKYASAFYGPFRDAIGSNTALKGDKRTYQMDPGNAAEALREVELDLAEAADMIMVKPGMPYLDIVRRVKDRFGAPTFVYQVSGEYAMLMAAAQQGWLNERAVVMESLLSIKRAGADGILTYFAKRAAAWLRADRGTAV